MRANAADVKVGGCGAMDTDDPAMDTDDPAAEEGHYLVQWKGLPFSAQEQMTTREVVIACNRAARMSQ